MGEFEQISGIAAAAVSRVGNELAFTFPDVLHVVKICTQHEVAVLGIELFEVHTDGYSTKRLSLYSHDQSAQQQLNRTLQESGWQGYVGASNALAEEFIRQNPTGDEHVYLLTTSSWREFREIQKIKHQ
jgi:hypothetical protein